MYGSRHRATLSLATSVDLDVEGGGRLDEDYDGGWSTSSLAWSAKGPVGYTSSMGIVQSLKCHLAWAKMGAWDANRWTEAFQVATRSSDIQFGIVKGLLLSASIAAVIFFFELAFFPTHLFPGRTSTKFDDENQSVGSVGSVFWLYPLIAGSYFLASSWTVDVAKAAHQLKHGRMLSSIAASPGLSPGTTRTVLMESYRVILVINYVAISVALQQIPFVGRLLSFSFMSFIDAYYCFEQGWIARGWSVERRMRYAESRWAYFMAFGLPSTAVSYFHPSGLLNLMLFMLVFPICTVLAMLSNPQPRQAPTGAAPLTPSNSGLSPALANNASLSAFLPPRLPIFWPTVKAYRLLLRLFPRVLDPGVASPGATASGNASAWRNARQFANPALFAAAGNVNPAARGMYNVPGASDPSTYQGFGTGVDRGTGTNTTGKRGGAPSPGEVAFGVPVTTSDGASAHLSQNGYANGFTPSSYGQQSEAIQHNQLSPAVAEGTASAPFANGASSNGWAAHAGTQPASASIAVGYARSNGKKRE